MRSRPVPTDCRAVLEVSRSSLDVVPIGLDAHALFLDFDGTLAPIQDDPDTVALPGGGAETLIAVARKLNEALVLISGRDVRDLSMRTPEALWRAGGHGLEICEPGMAPSSQRASIDPDLRARLEALVSPMAGVRIEDKGPVLAIHYRQAPAAGAALSRQLTELVSAQPDYKVQSGKMVIELKPIQASKGLALQGLMTRMPFHGRTPVMVGDDTTDEDAMQAAIALGGFGIKVGEGDSCASFRFKDTEMVWDWLRRIAHEHA